MTTIHADAGEEGYQLKSDLARICLPAPHAHDQRNLAWTNSICLLFLLIGLVGFRAAPPPPIAVKPLEEPAPVVIETQPPPPTPVELNQDVQPLAKPEAAPPRVVIVTPESPAIRFSVSTVGGNLVVPNSLAVAPPANPAAQAAPRHEAAPDR